MKSSSLSGICSVCDHANASHVKEQCGARGCRKNIKICGTTAHYIPDLQDPNCYSWIVCTPCPDHGRQGRDNDYSCYPVIAKDESGNLIIILEGFDENLAMIGGQSMSGQSSSMGALATHQQASSSSQPDPGSVQVELYWKRDLVCFNYQGKEVKTKPERWTTYEAGGYTYYLFKSNDYGLTFYSFVWPGQ
ncbi:hypothetical protein BKA60DRAFT_626903 [Fusarium oxysporum]|nr:hypothetical protein BKA60DRAFT_626903 [Fusarium oxysporum]